MADAMGLSVGWPTMNVAGPPTGAPTENFTAFGFGVGSILITAQFLSADRAASQLPFPGLLRWLRPILAFSK